MSERPSQQRLSLASGRMRSANGSDAAASPRKSVAPPSGTPTGQQALTSQRASSRTSTNAAKEAEKKHQEQQVRDRQTRIVASTFANMELFMTQQTHEATVKLHAEASAQCERLKTELEERDRDSIEVVDFLRGDAAAKAARLKELDLQLASHEKQKSEDEQALRRRYEAIIKEKEATIRTAEDQIERLSSELDAAAQYQVERSELLLELDVLRSKLKNTIEHYEQELNRVKFAAVEERVRLQALEAEMASKFKDEVEQRSTAIAKLKQQHVFAVNERLSKDRQILEQEVDALVKLANEYRARIDENKRDQEVSEDVHSHAIHAAVALKMRADDAETQRRYAEAERVEAIEALRKEKKAREDQLLSKVELLERELNESKKTQKQQAAELARFRKLSSTLVSNRSTLEQFFHAALAELREFKKQEGRGVEGGCTTAALGSQQPRLAITGTLSTDGRGGSTNEEDTTFLTSVRPQTEPATNGAEGTSGSSTPRHLLQLIRNASPSASRIRLLTGDRSSRQEVVGNYTKEKAHRSRKSAAVSEGPSTASGEYPSVPSELLFGVPSNKSTSPPASLMMFYPSAFGGEGAKGQRFSDKLSEKTDAERTVDPMANVHNHAADARMLGSASRREMMSSASGSGRRGVGRVGPLYPLVSSGGGDGEFLDGDARTCIAQQFDGMSWTEKELIVKGMLKFMSANPPNNITSFSARGKDVEARTEASEAEERCSKVPRSAGVIDPSVESLAHDIMGGVLGLSRPSTAAVPVTTLEGIGIGQEDVAWDHHQETKHHGKLHVGAKPPPPRPPALARPATSSAKTIQDGAFAPKPPQNAGRASASADRNNADLAEATEGARGGTAAAFRFVPSYHSLSGRSSRVHSASSTVSSEDVRRPATRGVPVSSNVASPTLPMVSPRKTNNRNLSQ